MSQLDKLLREMRANPRAVRFGDLKRVLESRGVVIRQGRGSHCVAVRAGVLYTLKKPGPGRFVHPKAVKHCLQAFELWDPDTR